MRDVRISGSAARAGVAADAYDSRVGADDPTPPRGKKGAIARAAESVAGAVGEVANQAGAAATEAGAAAVRLVEERGRRVARRVRPDPLPSLFDHHPEARTAPRRELGVLTIPVAGVRGTAVEGAAQRGADFLPLPGLRGPNWQSRWQRLRAAHERLDMLPPIDVFQTDDGYWVVDGHNRVALARAVGQDDIDASVTHLHLPGSSDADVPHGPLETVLADSRDLRSATRGRPNEPS